MNAEIILQEKGRVPIVGVSDDWSVLRERAWKTQLEIGQGILADRAIEGENTVVVQQCLLNVFVEGEFAPKLDRMAAMRVTESVPQRVKIGACQRTCNCLPQREEVRDRDLWQRGSSLNGEKRAQSAQRCLGYIQAFGKIARV